MKSTPWYETPESTAAQLGESNRDQSQGWFPFGLACAKRKLAEATKKLEEAASELDPKSLAVAMGSIEKQDGPSYADIQERYNLDRNNGATDD